MSPRNAKAAWQLVPQPEPATAPESLSHRLWGIDWKAYFPFRLSDRITVDTTDYETVGRFSAQYFPRIYGLDPAASPFLVSDNTEARARYYALAGDFFVFRDGGRAVGVFVGTPLDWSSYYLRNASLLPEYQGQKLYQGFLRYF